VQFGALHASFYADSFEYDYVGVHNQKKSSYTGYFQIWKVSIYGNHAKKVVFALFSDGPSLKLMGQCAIESHCISFFIPQTPNSFG
jgi:hypothetical protein